MVDCLHTYNIFTLRTALFRNECDHGWLVGLGYLLTDVRYCMYVHTVLVGERGLGDGDGSAVMKGRKRDGGTEKGTRLGM